jgi:hypothetical protein
MAEEKEDKEKGGKKKNGSIFKEILSGSMVSEKIILSNLGYISLVTLLLAILYRQPFSCRKDNKDVGKASEGS